MTNVIVAMLGARRHYAVPRLLHEAGLLARFFTDSYSGNKPWLRRMVQAIPDKSRPANLDRWLGRADATLPPERVVSFEGLGWWYARERRRGGNNVRYVSDEATRRFHQQIIANPAFSEGQIVWGFNGASLDLFRAAKERGKRCVLDQTSYPKRLTAELVRSQLRRWPDWDRYEDRLLEAQRNAARGVVREETEWALADRIVGGSEFVREGLIAMGVPAAKIHVVPYGVDPNSYSAVGHTMKEITSDKPGQPLRVLFAGKVGVWKGAPDLLEALGYLPSGCVEARLVGRIDLHVDKLSKLPSAVEFLGAVPRARMAELYRWADVFVCPSISEGSAGVTYEALMSGLPVIATPNAGAPVRDNVDGMLVPIRDAQALATALKRYLDEPELLHAHHQAALRDRQRLGLDAYRENLIGVVQDLTDERRR